MITHTHTHTHTYRDTFSIVGLFEENGGEGVEKSGIRE
jgi:hypothetical protein